MTAPNAALSFTSMHFAKHWARGIHEGTNAAGRSRSYIAWRWSDESQADAREQADRAAADLARRAAQGDLPEHAYSYRDQPLREEVIREIDNRRGERCAVITRNAHGCLVLNTTRVMFVDIDLPGLETAPDRVGFLGRLFGGRSRDELIDPVLRKAQTFAYSNSAWGWRAYATKAGLRLIAINGLFEPDSPETAKAFEGMNADPLYIKLCNVQQSYRARLTPKPWRFGLSRPPVRWPFPNEQAERDFQEWDAEYISNSSTLATCRFLRLIGNEYLHPEIERVVRLHDEITNAHSDLDLA